MKLFLQNESTLVDIVTEIKINIYLQEKKNNKKLTNNDDKKNANSFL